MSVDGVAHSPAVETVAVVLASLVAARLLVALLRPLLARAARRSAWQWDDLLVERVTLPVSLVVGLQAVRASLPWLGLDPRALTLIAEVTAIVTSVLVLWIAFRTIDLVVEIAGRRPWARDRPASRSLLAIAGRAIKVVLMALAAIVMLAQFGVSVASLIAGLGIGGLALALAAQKTVENLFGTMSIAIDQPLREGDFVRAGEHLGTVEAIGLRSTRIRTLDRTLVTVPNGQLADQRVESYSARDRLRFTCTLGLVYGTSAEQLRGVLAELEATLRAHPLIWPDAVTVRFIGFGASSLDIDVMAWFQLNDWNQFTALRQELLLRFMEIVEGRTGGFAFPTTTVHVVPPEPARS
ncbi:MAG TPA: mechanosensitive ion channel family protein [Kofleriaceae bacterium]|nr:mechanosensitive ion channel family protein [Kofleriaceae bacterium]